jgi:proteasome assembly chaperone (PAC2) family protein
VGDLESLKAITRFSLLADYVKNGVNELSTFGVVTLSPVITSSGLSENKVVGAEKLSEWTSAYGVHGSWLKIHEYGARDVTSSGSLVVVDVDALELEIGVTMVGTGRVYSVLIGDNFPELGTNLVTALASLDVNEFSHLD